MSQDRKPVTEPATVAPVEAGTRALNCYCWHWPPPACQTQRGTPAEPHRTDSPRGLGDVRCSPAEKDPEVLRQSTEVRSGGAGTAGALAAHSVTEGRALLELCSQPSAGVLLLISQVVGSDLQSQSSGLSQTDS